MVYRTIPIATVALLFLVPAQAGPVENQEALWAGAERLLELQLEDGSFPILGPPFAPNPSINVQGAIPHGLLETFKVTGNLSYLGLEPGVLPADATTGVLGARNYLVNHLEENPSVTLTTSGIYFIAEVGLITGNRDDINLAREHMDRWTGSMTADEFMDHLFDRRGANNYHMAFWDMGRFIRSAHDVGDVGLAHDLGNAMASQTRVDLFDTSANWNEYGVSGFIFGLSESDSLAHRAAVEEARDHLLTLTCEDGGFTFTYYTYDPCDSVQSTAFAVQALAFAGEVLLPQFQAACANLAAEQNDEGFWRYGTIEYVQTNADALVGLAACQAPVRNAATSYADAVIQLL